MPYKQLLRRLSRRTYQELSIIPDLTVLENVLMGDPRLGMVFRSSRYSGEVRELLDRIGLSEIPLDISAGRLTVAEQQLLEICRAVMRQSKVLILDEPTASLSDAEIQRVFETVRWLRQSGTAVIYISHRLPEIFALTDRITVFRNGLRIQTKNTADWDSEELIREMIGRDVLAIEQSTGKDDDDRPTAIEFRDFAVPGKIERLNLHVRRGQVVGIIGQLGSGANTIAEALAGLERKYSGAISVEGVEVSLNSQSAAKRAGISYVTEDRGAKSLFKGATVQQNLTCANLAMLTRSGIVDRKAVATCGKKLAERFQIDLGKLGFDISSLSGGNQQKVAIAKSVAVDPKVLVLNEPTRGVDVGARTEIYRELKSLADLGMTIVFFSTDLEEIKELSDRVVSVFKGCVVNDRRASETSTDQILSDILRGADRQGLAA
ncbi:sugar ABC transporter ATP-binding protein [Rhizobium sp. 18055]|uniref:sugar ABC transporter ATP-binding protein n=1 Tax=Rhizobium sp. 18055 TaxID=2681403 RepID=UPI002452A19E|nr:sugar ABC transporter ATP-binding protein [Rhizobium sp. 18055]